VGRGERAHARSRIEARLFSSAPGRRYVAGTSATILPEDYNEAGALWEHLARHGVPFFNFGFGTEMPASLELQMFKETGIRMAVSFPLPKPLFDRTSRVFPTFNMAIPDQYRADVFEQELRDLFKRRCDLPSGGYLIIEPTEQTLFVYGELQVKRHSVQERGAFSSFSFDNCPR